MSTTGAPLGLSIISGNPQLELTADTLNSTPAAPSAFGCTGAGSSPPVSAGCGSVAFTAASGLFQSASFNNVSPAIGGDDQWWWAITFPTAPLSAAFASPTITAGATTTLTFTITNPSDPGSTALSPLDFTTALPAGLSIANATSTTNGACGTPSVTDAAGDPLATGKSANKNAVRVGRKVTFTLRVRNPSKVAVRNVRVCDRIPSGLTYVSSSPASKSSFGRRCRTVGTLAAGARRRSPS